MNFISYHKSFISLFFLKGGPACGKTPAMNLIRNCVHQVDLFNSVELECSQIINAGTVEGLLHYMKKLGEYEKQFF